jgi:hypothetical protein
MAPSYCRTAELQALWEPERVTLLSNVHETIILTCNSSVAGWAHLAEDGKAFHKYREVFWQAEQL